MTTPCNKLVQGRVRGISSCFSICRLPIVQEPEKMLHRKKALDSNTVCCKPPKAKRASKKSKKEEEITIESDLPDTVNNIGQSSSESDPRFSKGDYIVFRLTKNGEIDKSSEIYRETDHQRKPKPSLVVEEERNEKESANASNVESFDSCESNVSDNSSGSFAFPRLSFDCIGSPVHMPKPEHVECVLLNCCRSS